MKCSNLLFLVLICLTSVGINGAQRDSIKPGAFDPEVGARLFLNGLFNPRARCSIFAPRGTKAKELINRYTNYLIPSKQEVIENVSTTVVHNSTIIPKLIAVTSCLALEACQKYPQMLSNAHSEHLNQRRAAGYTLQASELEPTNAPNSVKTKAKEQALTAAGKQALYDCAKLYAIGYVRSKIDPYLKQGLRKTELMQNIQNRKLVAALGYIAHRSLNCALDIGCDAAYSGLKGLVVK